MQVDAIIFDMDGTLFDSSDVVPAAYLETFAELGRHGLGAPDVIARYPLGPPINILRDVHGDDADAEHVSRYHHHLRRGAAALATYPGIAELLDDLAHRDVPRAVFTGADTASARMLVGATGLDRFFDQSLLLGTDLVEHPKPDPGGLLLACERLGVEPGRAAYVGDSPLDQQAARAAGCVAVAAGWGHLHDAAEPADLVATTPRELLALLDPETRASRA